MLCVVQRPWVEIMLNSHSFTQQNFIHFFLKLWYVWYILSQALHFIDQFHQWSPDGYNHTTQVISFCLAGKAIWHVLVSSIKGCQVQSHFLFLFSVKSMSFSIEEFSFSHAFILFLIKYEQKKFEKLKKN